INGATAVPESTVKPPKRTKQTMMGRSQNFFRSFMKDQSSKKSSVIESLRGLVLSLQMRCRPRISRYAVAIEVRSQAPPHRIFSQPAAKDSERRHDPVENQAQKNSRVDPAHDMTEGHPPFERPEQRAGENQCRQEKKYRRDTRPPARSHAVNDRRPKAYQRENASDG